MSLQIIIKGKNHFGKSRAERESNLRKIGYISMSDENYDRVKWIEKKTGVKGFVPQPVIRDTDMADGSSSKDKV